eukprot:gnl/MRDRNA2_/MRDRNA2_106798_c0_seq1.p1 gnl/MRDRNA2_/MRDRNA2_106798_c0~~gnl/MRDRNA2_/MRDRNA2_106798_c0_seq1.p1  ORF type:complete len:367 (+),score=84.06 gnl/MRDRNA2_/MRDRNA2_106798_c0_seq1:71-1171(+)
MSDSDIIGALGERAFSPGPPTGGFTSGSDSDGTFGGLLKDVKSLLEIKPPQRKSIQADAVANDVAQISRQGAGIVAAQLANARLEEAARAREDETMQKMGDFQGDFLSDSSPSVPVGPGSRQKKHAKRERIPISDDDMTVTSSDGGGSSESPTPKARSVELSRDKVQSQAVRPTKDGQGFAARKELHRSATSQGDSFQAKKDTLPVSMRRASAPAVAPGNVPMPKSKVAAVAKEIGAPPPPDGLRDGLRTQHISMLCALQVLSAGELDVLLSQWQQEWLHTSGRATDVAVKAAIATKQGMIMRKEERRQHRKQRGTRESDKVAEVETKRPSTAPSNSGLPSPAITTPAPAVYSTHGRLAEWRGTFR